MYGHILNVIITSEKLLHEWEEQKLIRDLLFHTQLSRNQTYGILSVGSTKFYLTCKNLCNKNIYSMGNRIAMIFQSDLHSFYVNPHDEVHKYFSALTYLPSIPANH